MSEAEVPKERGKLINGENVITSVLRLFQTRPDEPITSRTLREAFKDEIPSGNGLSAALWSLRTLGLIELIESVGRLRTYRLTEAGRLREAPVGYLSSPRKKKEPAPPDGASNEPVEPVTSVEPTVEPGVEHDAP